MTLPLPTLDHVAVNVRNCMDEACDRFIRLGFTLTPRGYHTLGSINHLAIFGTDYLELIGTETASAQRQDILGWPIGLNGLVFGTDDSAATWRALRDAGVPVGEPVEFSRPVDLPDGRHDAVFRTVRLPHEAFPAGRLYFCHHATRGLVWRDEWRVHANGTIGIARALIASATPEAAAELFRTMFGARAVRAIDGGYRLALGLASFDVVAPQQLRREFGDAAPDGGGRRDWMAGLVLRSCDLAATAAALMAGGIAGVRETASGICVPAGSALDTLLVFVP